MFRDRALIRGKVTATVFLQDGKPKERDSITFWQFIKAAFASCGLDEFRRMLKYEYAVNHNIVTDQGDALVADRMANTQARSHVNNTNGVIQVGTGWTGTNPKLNTGVNTPTGSAKGMSATYPKLKGAWGLANDNVVQYQSIFQAGDLNASGIDEASLQNGTDNLAYAQIVPSVTVSTTDTLQIDWEITFLGA